MCIRDRYLDLPSESTDAVFSRFGVMTFNDPVAAFANFRRILRPSGALAFCCWRSLQENELDHLPLSAAGFQSTVDESPFSFADPEHIRHILEAAGFSEIVIQSHNEKVSSGGLDATSESWPARKDRSRKPRAASDCRASTT